MRFNINCFIMSFLFIFAIFGMSSVGYTQKVIDLLKQETLFELQSVSFGKNSEMSFKIKNISGTDLMIGSIASLNARVELNNGFAFYHADYGVDRNDVVLIKNNESVTLSILIDETSYEKLKISTECSISFGYKKEGNQNFTYTGLDFKDSQISCNGPFKQGLNFDKPDKKGKQIKGFPFRAYF